MDSEQEENSAVQAKEIPEPIPDTGPWAVASKLVSRAKRPPSNFIVTIRTLLSKPEVRAGELDSKARFEVGRLLRSSSILACYYYASKSYRSEIFSNNPKIGSKVFENSFSGIDHAALLTLIVYNRSFAKKSNKEEWAYIEAPLFEALDVGALVARTIKEIELGAALLCRGMRYLAFAPFLWESEDSFREYRRYLKKEDLAFDLDYEQKVWGCTNVHISAILLSLAGFSRSSSMALYLADVVPTGKDADNYLRRQFFLAERILQSITEGSDIPESPLPQITISETDRQNLSSQARALIDNPSPIEWLNKGKSNINPESTPELFNATSPES